MASADGGAGSSADQQGDRASIQVGGSSLPALNPMYASHSLARGDLCLGVLVLGKGGVRGECAAMGARGTCLLARGALRAARHLQGSLFPSAILIVVWRSARAGTPPSLILIFGAWAAASTTSSAALRPRRLGARRRRRDRGRRRHVAAFRRPVCNDLAQRRHQRCRRRRARAADAAAGVTHSTATQSMTSQPTLRLTAHPGPQAGRRPRWPSWPHWARAATRNSHFLLKI